MLAAAIALQPSKPMIMARFAGFYQYDSVKLDTAPAHSTHRGTSHFKKWVR